MFMLKNALHAIEVHPKIKPCRLSVLECLTGTIDNHDDFANGSYNHRDRAQQ